MGLGIHYMGGFLAHKDVWYRQFGGGGGLIFQVVFIKRTTKRTNKPDQAEGL